MNIIEALVLGFVQGLTEFLPVSSSGHLVLIQNIFGIEENPLFFDTMLHVGTLVAVAVVLWEDIADILTHPFRRLTWLLLVATVPAVIAALLFNDFFTGAFEGKYLGCGFLLTSLLLTLSERLVARKRVKRMEMTFPAAAGIGCMQAVAILPGVSRAGATLSAGLLSGLERTYAAKFSFLMSIPVILGSVVFQGYDMVKEGVGNISVLSTVIGTLAAAVTGYFAVRFMLRLIRKKKLYGFAVYTGILGAAVLLDQLVLHIVF